MTTEKKPTGPMLAFYKKLKERKTGWEVYENAFEFFADECTKCNMCVAQCSAVSVGCLQDKKEATIQSKMSECIACGQCTTKCMLGAIREISHVEEVKNVLADKSKYVIVQMAPSIRVSMGDFFKLPLGANVEKLLYGVFRKMGFDAIFDVTLGADLTTLTEAEEFLEKAQEKYLPLFTGCCPAWVLFAEKKYSHILPYITTTKSPHMQSGGVYKFWYAKRHNIDIKDIVVVSVMPCVAKKQEIAREELWIDGIKPVDYVITSRELIAMMDEQELHLLDMEESEMDDLGGFSGSGLIYGASGWVAQSAVKTAVYMQSKQKIEDIIWEDSAVFTGLKEGRAQAGNDMLKIAVISGIKNVDVFLADEKEIWREYDYIEIMACPGGCIGGGGQPLLALPQTLQERAFALKKAKEGLVKQEAYENELACQIIQDCQKEGIDKKLFFTKHI